MEPQASSSVVNIYNKFIEQHPEYKGSTALIPAIQILSDRIYCQKLPRYADMSELESDMEVQAAIVADFLKGRDIKDLPVVDTLLHFIESFKFAISNMSYTRTPSLSEEDKTILAKSDIKDRFMAYAANKFSDEIAEMKESGFKEEDMMKGVVFDGIVRSFLRDDNHSEEERIALAHFLEADDQYRKLLDIPDNELNEHNYNFYRLLATVVPKEVSEGIRDNRAALLDAEAEKINAIRASAKARPTTPTLEAVADVLQKEVPDLDQDRESILNGLKMLEECGMSFALNKAHPTLNIKTPVLYRNGVEKSQITFKVNVDKIRFLKTESGRTSFIIHGSDDKKSVTVFCDGEKEYLVNKPMSTSLKELQAACGPENRLFIPHSINRHLVGKLLYQDREKIQGAFNVKSDVAVSILMAMRGSGYSLGEQTRKKGYKEFPLNNGKTGVELKNGHWIQVDEIGPQKEGFSVIRLGDKYNYLSQDGNLLAREWLDAAEPFINGKASCLRHNEALVIDKEGKVTEKSVMRIYVPKNQNKMRLS